MALTDLLVHLDASKHCAARLTLASALARRFDAGLTALYVGAEDAIPPTMGDQYRAADLDAIDTAHALEREAAETLFNSCVPEAATLRRQLIEERGEVAEAVTRHARYHDLAVLGQVDPEGEATAGELSVPDLVGLRSGRPILMVPYVGSFPTVGERVLVAWKDSAQSARSVMDALPLLASAKSVTVVTIARDAGEDVSTEGILGFLDRHGITAESERLVARESEVADLLLSRAADETADLMVMGLYSHSRLTEQVFGGVSREVLRHMTIPVLMSH